MLILYRDVLKSLSSHKVKYVVIGGMAAILHGVPRTTLDLDLLIEATEKNAEKLLDSLKTCHFGTAYLTTAERVANTEITIFRDRLRIDVQTRTPGLTFATAWKNRDRRVLNRVPINLASQRDLIRSKRSAGRPIDLEDVRLLSLIRKAH